MQENEIIKIDKNLKDEVGLILEQMGLNHEDIVKILYTQIKIWNKIPFDIKLPATVDNDSVLIQSQDNGISYEISTIKDGKYFTGTKPKKLIIDIEEDGKENSKEFTVFKWIEVFAIICDYFYKKDSTLFEAITNDRIFHTDKRDIFSQGESPKINKPGTIGDEKKILFNKTLSTSDIIKYLKLVIEKYKYGKSIRFYLENEPTLSE